MSNQLIFLVLVLSVKYALLVKSSQAIKGELLNEVLILLYP